MAKVEDVRAVTKGIHDIAGCINQPLPTGHHVFWCQVALNTAAGLHMGCGPVW